MKQYIAWIIGAIAIASYAAILFGKAGFFTITGIVFLFILPGMFIMRKTGFDPEEKIFFSLFSCIGLFPLLAFGINQVVPSFKISAIAGWLLVAVIGMSVPILVKNLRKPKMQTQ
jgi:hypothetical protein